MIVRQNASIDHRDDAGRPTAAGQKFFHLLPVRRKTAIKTDRKLQAGGRFVCLANFFQPLAIDSQRLFHKHMLAGTQCRGRQSCVGIVPRGNHHGVNVRVVDNRRGCRWYTRQY